MFFITLRPFGSVIKDFSSSNLPISLLRKLERTSTRLIKAKLDLNFLHIIN